MTSAWDANVTVVGLENSPSMNSIYAGFQNDIRAQIKNGIKSETTIDGVQKQLTDYYQQKGIDFMGGIDLDTAKEASILYEATQQNMKVVGIDPRLDDPQWNKDEDLMDMWRKHEIDDEAIKAHFSAKDIDEASSKHYFRLDSQMAKNTADGMADQPLGSRMLILAGGGHVQPEIDRPSGVPLRLADALPELGYGSVTTITNNRCDYVLLSPLGQRSPSKPGGHDVNAERLHDNVQMNAEPGPRTPVQIHLNPPQP
jgi:hypothetical protein